VTTFWSDSAEREQDRQQVAREMVAVLLQRPQPPVGGAAALRTADTEPADPPLAFELLKQRMYWPGTGPPEVNQLAVGRCPANGTLATRRRTTAQQRGDFVSPRAPTVSASDHQRPGRSGRPNKRREISESRVLGEVTDRFGEGSFEVVRGVHLYRWTLHPDGDGIIAARLSGPELKKGDTIGTQVHTNLVFAERMGLRPRELVVTLGNSGGNDHGLRVDLQRVEAGYEAGWLEWELWRGADRMFRRGSVEHLHYEWLQDTGVQLYLAELGHAVDWSDDNDVMWLDFAGPMARQERRRTFRRTQDALIDRMLSQGRGWPNSIRFGTFRGDDGFLWVDTLVPAGKQLSDWEIVHWMKRRYVELCQERKGGLAPLREELAAMGYEFCQRHLLKILRDSIYVDGHSSITYGKKGEKQPFHCEPLRGMNACARSAPVSRELHQQVLDLLAVRKGPHSAVNEGTFLLNSVPFFHARCQHERKEIAGKTKRPRLSARSYPPERKLRPTYAHAPFVPVGCRNWTLDLVAVETAVVTRLLELADADELAYEWLNAGRGESNGEPALMQPAAVRRLREEVAHLQAQRDRLKDDWAAEVRAGGKADLDLLREGMAVLDEEITRVTAEMAGHRPQIEPASAPAGPSKAELVARMREVLTPECPEDLRLRVQRAALLRHCLSAVIAHDTPEGIVLELHGPLVPQGARVTVDSHGPRGGAREWLDEEVALTSERRRAAAVEAARVAAGGGQRHPTPAHESDREGRNESDADDDASTSHTANEEHSQFPVCDLSGEPARAADYRELRRRFHERTLGPHEAPTYERVTRARATRDDWAGRDKLDPAWQALTQPERALPRDTYLPERVRWDSSRAIESLAAALLEHPEFAPLNWPGVPALTRRCGAAAVPGHGALRAICQREAGWTRPRDLVEAATALFYELRPEGPATAEELAAAQLAHRPGPRGTPRAGEERRDHQSRCPGRPSPQQEQKDSPRHRRRLAQSAVPTVQKLQTWSPDEGVRTCLLAPSPHPLS
jgi:hypothetical protein